MTAEYQSGLDMGLHIGFLIGTVFIFIVVYVGFPLCYFVTKRIFKD